MHFYDFLGTWTLLHVPNVLMWCSFWEIWKLCGFLSSLCLQSTWGNIGFQILSAENLNWANVFAKFPLEIICQVPIGNCPIWMYFALAWDSWPTQFWFLICFGDVAWWHICRSLHTDYLQDILRPTWHDDIYVAAYFKAMQLKLEHIVSWNNKLMYCKVAPSVSTWNTSHPRHRHHNATCLLRPILVPIWWLICTTSCLMSFHVEHLNQASRHCLTFIRLLLHLAHEGVHSGEDDEAGLRNPHKHFHVCGACRN